MKPKAFTFILILIVCVLVIAGAVIAYVGVQGSRHCPGHIGIARYELDASTSEADILRFINFAIDNSGGSHYPQNRWPPAKSVEEAATAYRDSLTYRISYHQNKMLLEIYCIAVRSETAVDAVTFAGHLWYAKHQFGLPAMVDGGREAVGRKMTDRQKFIYGLGLFPPGKRLPPPPPSAAVANAPESAT